MFSDQSTNLFFEACRGKTSQICPIKFLVDHIFFCQEVPDSLLTTITFPLLHFCPEGFELKCSKCQIENPEGDKFCGECGESWRNFVLDAAIRILPIQILWRMRQPLEAKEAPISLDYTQPQSYTPKHLADKILTTRSSIEGERKLVTVMFADVANYTSVSEKLDPEEVHQMMDGCF